MQISTPADSSAPGAGSTPTHSWLVHPADNTTILAGDIVYTSTVSETFHEDMTVPGTPTVSWLEVAYSGADKRSSMSIEDGVTAGDWNLVLRFERSGFAQWTTLATKQTTTQLLLAILPAMSAVLAVMGIAFKYVVEPATNKCARRGDSSLADTKKKAAS